MNCDRACLEGLVNQYLTVLNARDLWRLPLSKDLRYTENHQVLEVGDGFCKTVEGRGNYSHYIRRAEMVGASAPYQMNSPWGGLSGN